MIGLRMDRSLARKMTIQGCCVGNRCEARESGNTDLIIERAALAIVLFALAAFQGPAAAQPSFNCPPAPSLETAETSVDTKVAANFLTKLLGKLGIDIDFRATRDSVLKDNPRADQLFIALTMANTLCVMIAADTTLTGTEKAERYQRMMTDVWARVSGPSIIARTDGKQSRSEQRRSRNLRAQVASAGGVGDSFDQMRLLTIAAGEAGTSGFGYSLPSERGFLRDPPFYVNDSNKYFVIVASAGSESEGRRMLAKLKAKTPQYDFVLYAPYGSNRFYGIMMASWVPLSVAREALELARRDVTRDAFLWACRSSGQGC